MRISIAIATYNGEKYLLEQLQSIMNQRRIPDELIVSDDCSSDRTVQIVENFSRNAPFQVKINQNLKNLGYAGNFNKALELTSGDLVFLSDQDDVWFPEKIATIVSIAEKNPAALAIMNDAELTDGKLRPLGLTKLGQLRTGGFSDKSFVMGCCAALRRPFLNIALPIPEGIASHDGWLIKIADALDAKVIIDRVLQYYRRHGFNESRAVHNKTKIISRRDVYIHWVVNVLKSDKSKITVNELAQLNIYINALKKAISKANAHQQARLIPHLIDKMENLSLLNQRKKVREAPFFNRMFQISKLWLSGQYQQTYGAKAIFRDLLG